MTHEILEVGLGSSDDHMEMVGHEDKGKKTDLIDLKGTIEDVEESISVPIGKEDVLSGVATAGHMIAGVLKLDA